MTKTIKVFNFRRAMHNGFEPSVIVDDYKAFLDSKRVGFVRITTIHTEDMEGRIFTEEFTEEKQIDSEEVRRTIYQSIGG